MDSPKSWGRTFMVLTGASRGFGATLCESLAPYLGSGSVIVGLARTTSGLIDTEKKVSVANSDVKFIPITVDLSSVTEEGFKGILYQALKEAGINISNGNTSSKFFSRAIIFHNVGSLGKMDYLKDISSTKLIDEYFTLNISSVISLNSCFLQIVGRICEVQVPIDVVHTSSLCAVQPIKSLGLYCTGKAARDMFFKTLALENPNLKVLNYAPGPLDNHMQDTLQQDSCDEGIREMFIKLKQDNQLVPSHLSADKLIQTLIHKNFKSGDHVDYYDVV